MTHKLFIIGNGFDLHHGIPSRYSDFGAYVKAADPAVAQLINDYLFVDENFWNCFEERLATFDSDLVIDHAEQFLMPYSAEDWSDAYHHDFEYAFRQLTMDRYSTFTSAKVQDKQTAQIRIGHGQAGAAIAETLLRDYARFLDTVDPAEIRPIEKRAEIRARVGMIADYVYRGINELMLGAGGGAYRNTSPLQRFLRDMNVLRVHGFLDVETAAENLGRVQLGLEPNCPL